MIDSWPACPRGSEDRAGQGRRAMSMHECMDESEDAVIAKVCSVIRGCGGGGRSSGASVRPDFDEAAAGAGNRTAEQQEVLVGTHVDHLETALGHARVAHLAGAS